MNEGSNGGNRQGLLLGEQVVVFVKECIVVLLVYDWGLIFRGVNTTLEKQMTLTVDDLVDQYKCKCQKNNGEKCLG